MANRTRTLTPAQEIALQKVRQKNKRKREIKAEAELEVRRLIAERIAAAEWEEAIAVREADNAEVPRKVIHERGLLTRDRHTLDRILAKTEATKDLHAVAGPFRWIDNGARVRVEYPEFPTTSTAEDYPAVLVGVVEQDDDARAGWRVVSDESDQETELGTLPGHLHWEIEEADPERPGSLAAQLTEWAAE